MTSLVNKSYDWTLNYHKILIFSPPKSLKRLRAARIDQLADSNEPAISNNEVFCLCELVFTIITEYSNSSENLRPFKNDLNYS